MSETKTTDVQSEDLTHDARLVPHSLRRERLSWADQQAYLHALPDDAEEAVECEVKFSTPYANRARSEREASQRRK